jgi:hypothetical protein
MSRGAEGVQEVFPSRLEQIWDNPFEFETGYRPVRHRTAPDPRHRLQARLRHSDLFAAGTPKSWL